MSKILSALEKINANFYNGYNVEIHGGDAEEIAEMMIEFGKSHVKLALDTIFEEAKHGDQEHQDWLRNKFNEYPLENIK